MKVILDIKDDKYDSVIKMLKQFSFIKVTPVTPHKAQILKDLKEAVENLNLVKQGKLKARPAKDLLDEL
jgi:hypothetical protein